MRRAAMSSTAAASGFAVFLLAASVIQGQDGWGVTYSATEVCALRGSTVEIRCSYTYPSRINDLYTKVQKTFWFTEDYVDLKTKQAYSRRVQYRCENNNCSLIITDLRKSDSALYKFRFITNQPGGSFFGSPGVSLSVTELQVQVSRSSAYESTNWAELKCQSSCRPHRYPSYVWYKNGQRMMEGISPFSDYVYPADSISCAVGGYEAFPSPPVYPPKRPSVSASPSGEIVEGTSVTLTCSSEANPAANYTWNKESRNTDVPPLSEGPQLVLSSIRSSDSGEYYCTAGNQLGRRTTSEHISRNMKYAPKTSSLSASLSGEIEEGRSVTLTCSSDANPAANYTWYKENQTLLHGPEGIYRFTSIRSEDSGIYSCKSGNQHGWMNSTSVFLDVQYAPRPPSVSVSPSGEIEEGGSVTLTCSSDANPAATYTWYKESEESPKASGQMFTITDIRAEHSGIYYCEAQNRRGRHHSTLHLTVEAGASTITGNIIRSSLVVLMLSPLILLRLWMRKKKTLSSTTEPHEPEEIKLDSDPLYESICDAAAQTEDTEEQDDLV